MQRGSALILSLATGTLTLLSTVFLAASICGPWFTSGKHRFGPARVYHLYKYVAIARDTHTLADEEKAALAFLIIGLLVGFFGTIVGCARAFVEKIPGFLTIPFTASLMMSALIACACYGSVKQDPDLGWGFILAILAIFLALGAVVTGAIGLVIGRKKHREPYPNREFHNPCVYPGSVEMMN